MPVRSLTTRSGRRATRGDRGPAPYGRACTGPPGARSLERGVSGPVAHMRPPALPTFRAMKTAPRAFPRQLPPQPPQPSQPCELGGLPPVAGVHALDPLERLRTRTQALRADDGVAVCARVLLAAARSTAGRDPHPVLLAQELAGRLLAALDAEACGLPVAACWRPVLRCRHRPRLAPLQFALAGLGAQFGHDVPLAVVGSASGLSRGAPGAVEHAFHRSAQPLLYALDEAAHDTLAADWAALRVTEPLTHLAGLWSAERAREDALTSCRIYQRLAERPPLAAEFAAQLAARAGTAAALMLTPLSPR